MKKDYISPEIEINKINISDDILISSPGEGVDIDFHDDGLL